MTPIVIAVRWRETSPWTERGHAATTVEAEDLVAQLVADGAHAAGAFETGELILFEEQAPQDYRAHRMEARR